MTPEKLLLRAYWGGRVDSMERQVAMVWDCWQRWATLGGLFTTGWVSLQAKSHETVHLPTHAALDADMNRANEADAEGFYGFAQGGEHMHPDDRPPHLFMSVSVAGFEGGDRMAANKVVAHMQVGERARLEDPLPIDWLLDLGPRLVKDFVDVWQPDAVSLDSRELIRLNPHRGSGNPVVGFFTWLGPMVADPAVLPNTPVRESYAGGTLFGIDPTTADPIEDAAAIAVPLYESGVLNALPYVQGQPNPPSMA